MNSSFGSVPRRSNLSTQVGGPCLGFPGGLVLAAAAGEAGRPPGYLSTCRRLAPRFFVCSHRSYRQLSEHMLNVMYVYDSQFFPDLGSQFLNENGCFFSVLMSCSEGIKTSCLLSKSRTSKMHVPFSETNIPFLAPILKNGLWDQKMHLSHLKRGRSADKMSSRRVVIC